RGQDRDADQRHGREVAARSALGTGHVRASVRRRGARAGPGPGTAPGAAAAATTATRGLSRRGRAGAGLPLGRVRGTAGRVVTGRPCTLGGVVPALAGPARAAA